MKFRSYVEPPEPMRGLEVPPEVVAALGGGKRPAVTITINGHAWKSRVAIMGGRYLLGLSNANRRAAGVVTGDEVEVEVELDAEPRVVVEHANLRLIHLPVHASWRNQIEIFFSIVQCRGLTPNDFVDLVEVAQRLLGFQRRYEQTAVPFTWRFTGLTWSGCCAA
jgi:Domain of unknown function (DUF1905)